MCCGLESSLNSAERTFQTIVEAYATDMYRYAYFLCRDPHTAEDLVQETFSRAWRFLDNLREPSKAKSWLMTSLRREHARLYERYRPQFDDLDLDQLPGDSDSDAEVLSLRRAILGLPLKYRDAVVLQVVGGFSGQEIAEILDIPRATVNTRLFRARQHLRCSSRTAASSPPAARRTRR